jgi:hypothetical protein
LSPLTAVALSTGYDPSAPGFGCTDIIQPTRISDSYRTNILARGAWVGAIREEEDELTARNSSSIWGLVGAGAGAPGDRSGEALEHLMAERVGRWRLL